MIVSDDDLSSGIQEGAHTHFEQQIFNPWVGGDERGAHDSNYTCYECRQELAEAAYKERLALSRSPAGRQAHTSPTRTTRAATKSPQRMAQQQQQQQQDSGSGDRNSSGRRGHLGHVPNFNELHASFAARQASIKAANSRRVTVPQVRWRVRCSTGILWDQCCRLLLQEVAEHLQTTHSWDFHQQHQ